MGLFDGLRKKNAVQINEVSHNMLPAPICRCGWDEVFNRKTGFRPFAQMYLYSCLDKIYSGVSNVTFEPSTAKQSFQVNAIASFLDNNVTLLVNQWIFRGYIAVKYDKDGNYKVLDNTNDIRKNANGEIINKDTVVIYTPIYQTKRQAPIDLVKPLLDTLDTLSNNMLEASGTLGVLPIVSGNSIPANPKFKEEFAQTMSKDYGWSADQLKYFLSNAELKVDTIDLKIKDLELRDNILYTFKQLLSYFDVPVDMVIGGSTYDNVEGARKYFYETTIKSYAETLLKVGRALLTQSNQYIPQAALTYHIYNVAGMETTLSDMCSEKGAYVDLLQKLGASGLDVSDELAKVLSDIKRLYMEV